MIFATFRKLYIRRFIHITQKTKIGVVLSLDTNSGVLTETRPPKMRISNIYFPSKEFRHPAFIPFSIYSFLASSFSSIGGVLSMQSLLIAASSISPSVSTGIGLAATINWILKDGLGQLGGILFAAKFGHSFDLDPRFYRFYSMVCLQVGSLLELICALCPTLLFLPLASIANFAKNVSWMGMSVTRTKVMEEYQVGSNIAELSAKHWSQVVTASVVGMVGGIGVSLLGSLLPLSTVHFNLLAFPFFALSSLFFTWKSCKYINMRTLTVDRLKLIIDEMLREKLKAFENGLIQECIDAIPDPSKLVPRENIVKPINRGGPFSDIVINPRLTQQLAKTIKQIDEPYEAYNILTSLQADKFSVWYPKNLMDHELAVSLLIILCYCRQNCSPNREFDEQLQNCLSKHHDTALCISKTILRERSWQVRDDFISSGDGIELVPTDASFTEKNKQD
jgi:hypothetical protein